VAALNVNETAVYHQIEAVLNDSSVIDKKEKRTKIDAILDASSDAIKEKLKAIFPFFFEYDVEHGHGDHKGEHGHGDHSCGHGHGNHNGTLSTTPAASGSKSGTSFFKGIEAVFISLNR
uniref:Uncharacterized protein n=1 Tax=Plectus sambesii TaxID=2011161 RepID=A0A914UKN7_9BILA